jgi:anti-sigma regulatory factor (Ser/Thr protein kinase)
LSQFTFVDVAVRKGTPKRATPSEAIDRLLRKNGVVTTGEVVDATGLTRQAIHKHLRQMVEAGKLHAEGAGRGARYVARRTTAKLRRRREGLDESLLYRELQTKLPQLSELPPRADKILHYAFTEIANNAIDHSGAEFVECTLRLVESGVEVEIVDEGIGAFENVRRGLRLDSELDALAELSKGKTTTDPTRHSGQGIFFSSKAVDVFELDSGGVRWIVDNRRNDYAVGVAPPRRGTRVRLEVDRETRRDLRSIFDEFTTDLAFDRTRTIVRLFAHGASFVSRSEAKRLLHGLERFREVVLDFAGVEAVGQGFADEVFRVWAKAHPETALLPVDMLEPVAFMVRRAQAEANVS